MTKHYYSGRVIFHHIAKTAGQAAVDWLINNFGAGTVTPNLNGSHRELILRYGGNYPIINAHIGFDGTGLDPRYRYVTILRDPVDRFISWLHFVDKDVPLTKNVKDLKAGAQLFLRSEGEETNLTFLKSADNFCVSNFSSVIMRCNATWQQKLDAALSVITEYDLVGFQEDLPSFIDQIAKLLQLTNYTSLRMINVTSRRPRRDGISTNMLRNIYKLTQWDIEFYNKAKQMAHSYAREKQHVHNIEPFYQEFDDLWDSNVSPQRGYWRSAYLEHFRAKNVPTKIGIETGSDLVSNGMKGYLCYGPYLSLNPGRYCAVASGTWLTRGANCKADVCSNHGGVVYTQQDLLDSGIDGANWLLSLEFSLDQEENDIEFRMMVPDRHQVLLSRVTMVNREKIREMLELDVSPLSAKDELKEHRYLEKIIILPEQMVSKIGLRIGPTLETSGRDGFLCYGPYMHLGRGVYSIQLVGSIGPRGLAGAYAEVVCDSGKTTIHSQPLAITPFNEHADRMIGQPWAFSLKKDVSDLEIRLRVSGRSEINLCGIVLQRTGEENCRKLRIEKHVL